MMSTILDCESEVPVVVLHRIKKIVCARMGGDICVPEVPLHEAPLELVTAHDVVLVERHAICEVSPFLTKSGVAVKLIVADDCGLHAPLEQP
jgi:hypothetical protein